MERSEIPEGLRFLDVDWIYAIRESRGRWRFCRHGFVHDDVDRIGFFCFSFCRGGVVSPVSSKEGSSFSVREPMKCDVLEDRYVGHEDRANLRILKTKRS